MGREGGVAEREPTHEIQTELSRDLGLTSALAIGVGTMIAAGIFTLSGLAVGRVGSSAIVAFLLAAVVALFTALTYCEFSSIYPESGEAYLYARKTFPPPLAYMVGWLLLLGYTSSCGFYIASLSEYFVEFVWALDYHTLPGLVGLALLTLLNIRGTKESGNFQVVVTAGKVVLLLWFIAGGLQAFDTQVVVDKISTDMVKIGATSAMVFVTFFGFSAIAASAGEVVNPTKTIPRAIFISMGLVTVLYTLVVLVMLFAGLPEYTESAMGKVAQTFLGPVGGYVIVGGALFSMISASNASIMAGSRVALSMSQLGHLPREIGAVNQQTRTPVVSILFVGAAIGAFAVGLPLEQLALFANCVLLTALILVNIALVLHRRKHPDIERPFRVPLVPLLPILGVLSNAYLLTQIDQREPIYLAIGLTVLGGLGFLTWKGAQGADAALPGEPSRVALERTAPTPGKFRVLLPVANPANVDALMDLAAGIAEGQDGEVVALRVVVVPEQLPPSLVEAHVERERRVLDQARARALERGVNCSSLIRIGHDPARAILETARERGCHLIVLGWKGYTSTARRILGQVTDDVVRHAQSDLMLVRLGPDAKAPQRILLPSAGGPHARRAQRYASSIAKSQGGSLSLISVVDEGASEEQVQAQLVRLEESKAHVEGVDEVGTELVRHRSPAVGIIKAAEGYDAVVVGAAHQSRSLLFGSIPENIARRAPCTVIVVRRHLPWKALVERVLN